MIWCQGAENIGLSNGILTSAQKCTVYTMHARPRQTDRHAIKHHGNNATIRSNERIAL